MAEKLFISWEEYNSTVEKLAIQIADSGYKPDILIGIMRGGAPIIDVLSRVFKLKCAYLAVESYSGKGIEDQQGQLTFSREMSSTVKDLGGNLLLCDDLSDTGITLNLPNKASSKKNYLFKEWHQEIWSGASPSTIQIWTPLIHKDNKSGQMELIEESHKWGHIPHMDRKPKLLPKNYKTKTLNLNYGDVIIFSTLLIHRSLPTKFPRLSLPILLKNYKNKDNSFQDNRSFKIYSYSEITKIERILGNHFLSPFRLKNLDDDN